MNKSKSPGKKNNLFETFIGKNDIQKQKNRFSIRFKLPEVKASTGTTGKLNAANLNRLSKMAAKKGTSTQQAMYGGSKRNLLVPNMNITELNEDPSIESGSPPKRNLKSYRIKTKS
jgi:hypothetical protein